MLTVTVVLVPEAVAVMVVMVVVVSFLISLSFIFLICNDLSNTNESVFTLTTKRLLEMRKILDS